MAFEGEAPERAYPYWRGWQAVGCAVLFFGLVGTVGVSLIPAGYEKFQSGQLPTGIALLVLGVFGVPTLVMSLLTLLGGVRDTFRPPLLRVTGGALVLPTEARGEPPQDEYGEPVSAAPPHPEVVPFAAIRWARRAGPPLNPVLEVGHDLSPAPLQLARHMMRSADFDDLERLLRAALPAAFAAAPPSAA
ncbi:hypothetical protein [Frigoriglobus tundricola]|uniref:Uncharacterized protein n=1 Tax=Frigoriglobus tundricola TaxID=2774151 RepID=A0A6M5YUY2_9BACT|nr:hypothetical protein [Frigoriglobus tundricola]QJW97061.1 hypothetical protein FTUN_4625 [Frigoriglobus tundricola]